MKKLIFIFTILFTISANALWIPSEFEGQEQLGSFKISHSKKQCEIDNPTKTSDCEEIIGEYNYRYFKSFDVMKNDISNPIYEAKSLVVSCTDESDCISKESSQTCPVSDSYFPYIVVRLIDNTEVYCTRVVSYVQIPSGLRNVRIDQSLKTSHDSAKAIKDAENLSVRSRIKDMDFGKRMYAIVQLGNASKGLSKGQRRTLRTNLSGIKEDLMDGNICDAKVDINALTPDGTLILSEDITDIISRIDTYKTCP